MGSRTMAKGNRVSQTASLPAPTKGLNAKDALANMSSDYAITMDNWFPTPSSVDVRSGCEDYATGMTGAVETLAYYTTGTSQKLFAAVGGEIFDVTAGGAVGAAEVTGLSNDRWQYINFGTAGGFFLVMVNGEDRAQYYDGSTWAEIGTSGPGVHIVGIDTVDIIHINNFKNRIFLIEKDSFNAWYLPVSSIGGTATKLDLSGLFKLGGYLMAMVNWTIDNSAGIDDYAAFITSEGEVAIYSGIDPSSSTDWLLEGTFRMGSPIGRRCAIKVGADVVVLTVDGAFPLSKSMLTDRTQLGLSLSDKISPLINADIRAYKDNFGWDIIYYPIGNKLIINVPTTEGEVSRQYVMNTQHGAWTRFLNWNAFCFEILNDQLYYGGDGVVVKADYGQSDNGADINSVCQQAFDYFGNRAQIKKFTMARPIFLAEATISPAIVMNVDFQDNRTTVSPSYTSSSSAEWDAGDWDSFDWAGGDEFTARWQSVTAIGYCGGIRVVTALRNVGCKWQASDIVFERGGVL